MKLKQQLPKTTYRGNVLTFLAVITLTGVFLSPLVTGPGMHDGLRMGKAFFFAQWMLLVVPVGVVIFIRHGSGSFYPAVEAAGGVAFTFGSVVVCQGNTGNSGSNEADNINA